MNIENKFLLLFLFLGHIYSSIVNIVIIMIIFMLKVQYTHYRRIGRGNVSALYYRYILPSISLHPLQEANWTNYFLLLKIIPKPKETTPCLPRYLQYSR